MDADLPTPLHIIQDSRYAKQDDWELDDISLCSSGNIAVSGNNYRTDQSYVSIYGSTVDNSDSRDKPTLLYHKQFTDKVSWWRYISFIKPNSTEIVTCQCDEVQVIDYNRDVVLRSRKVNGETMCLSVSESQIFIGLWRSDIVNIYDNDLNRIKSIRLKGIRGDWPRDIAAAADRLYVCTGWYPSRAIVYSQDSGSILTEYTTGQYCSKAWSMAVNIQHQIVAVLWYRGQVAVYSINSNTCLIVFNVESGVSRIRISDQGRVVTGNTATGEVKIYVLHSFVTYNTLKKWWQAVLQKNDCKRLMNHFHLPKDQKDSILITETPTNDLLLALEERDIIYQSNVSRLIDAFVALQLNETYYKAAKIYQENASATSYDRFLVTLSTHLTASLAKDLCSHFEIPDNKKSNITSNQNPGLSLLLALDKMGIINQSRVLTLEQPFTNLKLVQAVAKIQEYQSVIEDDRNLFQHTTGLTKEEKRNLFMKLLQKKITSWYEAMTPVPWKKSCQWKSSELFVGSGLILTNSKNGRNLLDVDEKCKLNYTEIFTHSSLEEETRIIIEGEPGSGKTMLSSQLAHDWSQGKISDITILILLPLKFVERKTLVEATKEYYLTEYKGLSLVDIEDVIIGEGVKCCFLLDGLEEYNGQDETSAEEMSEVMKVMTKVKYPNCKVILTSRSDYTQDLPPYPMLKLGTFGEVQRQIYIEKVFSDDFEKQMKVKNAIEDTPFILDLCSVPLLFVLAVHNIGSIVNMQDVWQDKVSPFIGLVVETLCPREKREDRVGVTQRCGCRYAHYDEDLNVFWNDEDEDIWGDHGDFNDFWDSSDSDSELDPFETYQNRSQGISLEMLAFNGLCRGKQQLSWQKKFVEENVRNMEKYLDSGILVVEDTVNVGMDIARTAKENADTEQVKEVWGKVNENIPRERDSDSGRAVITQKDNVDPAFNKEWERSVKERSDALENTKHKDRSNYDKPTIREESEPGEYLKAPLTVQHVSLQVKFLHKVLQEWFAARYLANICWEYGELALLNKYKFFREHLQQINPADLHYVLRFTCALCPPSCHLILNYLLSDFRNEEGKIPGHIMNCICLCLAEYDGYKGHYIKDVISEVCKADITIHSEDSRLIQRTKVSMLQFAANCGFPVSRLQLLDVVVRAAEDELTFTSGATLQTLHTLHEIEISRWDYALKEEDYANIVKFINNSTSIKKAVLYFPSQPPVLEPETLKDVAAKQITVAWHIGQVIQTLDPSKGIWMVQLREHYNQVTPSSVEPCQVHHDRSLLQAQATITQFGGTIEIPNTGVVLTVPPYALPEDMQECSIKMRIIPISMSYDEKTSFSSNSSVRVELLPNHFKFRFHVELTLPHCLELKKDVVHRARIFMSHHNEGERPQWEEQNEPFYHLGQKTCIILLKSFCWIKFEIDNEIVEGKRLKLYTAAKKMYLGDTCVAVHVGYHLDMPGEQEILWMNPNLILEQRHPFLFLREGKHPLLVQLLRIIPTQWKNIGKNQQEIPFQSVAASIEHSCTFVIEKKTNDCDIPMCVFVASQKQRIGKQAIKREINLMIRPEVSPFVSSSSNTSLTSSGNHHHPAAKSLDESMKLTILQLSRKLTDEWEFVGRELGLQNADLYRIKQDTSSTYNAIYKMLEYWRQIKGTEATFSNLIKSLKKAGRTDLAEKVQNLKDFFEEA